MASEIKTCKVYPAKGKRITGILPNNRAITEPGMYNLNTNEIRKCMKFGDVFEIVDDGTEVLIDEITINSAKATVTNVVPAAKVEESGDAINVKVSEVTDPVPETTNTVENTEPTSTETEKVEETPVENETVKEPVDEYVAETPVVEEKTTQYKSKNQQSKKNK